MTQRSNDDARVEVSSPACSMHEADDAYMGYAEKDELTALLNELLEAERAGVRVTLESARGGAGGRIVELMRTIERDEAHWWTMLILHITELGETPSPKVGAFYDEAMAIADLGERIAFLKCDQSRVARMLRETLPRVRDSRLCADLTEMLRSKEANIAIVDDIFGRAAG
jgi:hypothetical protein